MKKFRILFCLTTILLFNHEGIAQSHHISLFGGANYSTLGNQAYDLWKTGPSAGLGYEARFTDILFLEAGFVYNERGAKQSYEIFAQESNLQYDYPPVVFTHHYLSVPIAIGLRSRGKIAVFAQFGTVFSKILHSTSEYVANLDKLEVEYENTAYHPTLDLTLQLGTGVVAEFSSRIEGFARFSFEYGINNTYGYPDGDPHFGLLGHAGLKYRVGKSLE